MLCPICGFIDCFEPLNCVRCDDGAPNVTILQRADRHYKNYTDAYATRLRAISPSTVFFLVSLWLPKTLCFKSYPFPRAYNTYYLVTRIILWLNQILIKYYIDFYLGISFNRTNSEALTVQSVQVRH